MKRSNFWLLAASLTIATAAIGVAACSSNNDTGGNPSMPDNGGDAARDASSASDAENPVQDGGAKPTGDASCGTTPKLHADPAGTIFCGYTDAGPFSCMTGQECCLGGKAGKVFDPEVCATFGTACSNPVGAGLPVECGQVSDCTANGVSGAACCLQGAGLPSMASGCSYYKASGGTGIVCEGDAGVVTDASAPACAVGDVQICSSQNDCPIGMTCIPMKWKLYQVGFCQ